MLPILDKVIDKTLCLENYKLNAGLVMGLAKACEHLDSTKVNRMFFSNCGLSADDLATIIKGIGLMRDFKSLIIKKEIMNQRCIDNMVTCLSRRVPYHLSEISIIDCKINPTLIERLMEYVTDQSRLNKFSLVNVHHS